MIVSAWWIFAAFVAGGSAGMLLSALMFIASSGRDTSEQASGTPQKECHRCHGDHEGAGGVQT
jgi:hypothetical protein